MKILVIASDLRIPPLRYGGAERIVHNLSSALDENLFEVNLLAGKGSRKYGGRTLNYKKYRFGTSFFGRIINWAEFQFQTLRLFKDVDIIHSFIDWPELHFCLNKLKRPIIFCHQNPCQINTYKRIIKANPFYGYLQCVSNNQISKVEITKID